MAIFFYFTSSPYITTFYKVKTNNPHGESITYFICFMILLLIDLPTTNKSSFESITASEEWSLSEVTCLIFDIPSLLGKSICYFLVIN